MEPGRGHPGMTTWGLANEEWADHAGSRGVAKELATTTKWRYTNRCSESYW
jgi:hypothetical protein